MTLRTMDTLPTFLASLSIFWAENHDEDHERSCIGIRTCSTYVGDSCGTSSSSKGVGGEQVPELHGQKSSCLRSCSDQFL